MVRVLGEGHRSVYDGSETIQTGHWRGCGFGQRTQSRVDRL